MLPNPQPERFIGRPEAKKATRAGRGLWAMGGALSAVGCGRWIVGARCRLHAPSPAKKPDIRRRVSQTSADRATAIITACQCPLPIRCERAWRPAAFRRRSMRWCSFSPIGQYLTEDTPLALRPGARSGRLLIADCRLPTADCRLPITEYRQPTTDYVLVMSSVWVAVPTRPCLS